MKPRPFRSLRRTLQGALDSRQMTLMTENQLQKAVAKLLNSTGLIWCHVPNGGKRNAITGAMLKASGAKAGVPDCLVFEPFKHETGRVPGLNEVSIPVIELCLGLAIELKIGKNKPTPAQLKWHEDLRSCGWRVEVCYSTQEVLDLLRECYPSRFK